jgi:hypothetical protein
VEAERPARFLALGQVARFAGDLSGGVGFLYQPAISPSRVEVTETGRRIEYAPRWYLHTLATAGVGEGGPDPFRAGAQLGIARRNESRWITTSGIAAQALLRPRALGPVARAEVLDNIGVQAGWLFASGGSDGVYLSVDFMRDILSDLGITR